MRFYCLLYIMANHITVAEKVKLSMSQNIHIHFSSRIDWLDLDVSWSVKTELYLVQITGDTITQSLSDTITPSHGHSKLTLSD